MNRTPSVFAVVIMSGAIWWLATGGMTAIGPFLTSWGHWMQCLAT
ncbi:hypothetical protein [Sulfobacillus thermosulfidooxidans]|nr:hypothetical protein [Sulfobacillus thermosulfidooxidans]